MASVSAIWVSPQKRAPMEPRDRAYAIEGRGLDGCAHQRSGKRNVLFVSQSHLDDLGLRPGQIKENFTIEGADVHTWDVGQRVRMGAAEFEISMVCDPCHLMDEIRPGLQAELDGRRGMLARVVTSGDVARGDAVELLAASPRSAAAAAPSAAPSAGEAAA